MKGIARIAVAAVSVLSVTGCAVAYAGVAGSHVAKAAGSDATGIAGNVEADDVVKVTVSAAGDCTLGTDNAFNYSTSLNAKYKQTGPAYFLKRVKPVFTKDDLTIVNLEGTLTTRGSKADKTFAFKGSPSYTKILTSGSVEAVGFANNHCYDYGAVSYADTIKHVKKAGVKLSSYGKTSIYKVKGVKIGMVSVDDIGRYGGSAKPLIKSGVTKLKKQGADAIIVSIHAGVEKDYYPNATQKSLAHYAVNQGADLVLGHHPHVLQGVEKYKGVYICYSLGNFCFGGNSNPADKDTMIAQKTFIFKNGKLQKDKAFKVIPCSVSGHSSYNDCQPAVLSGASKKRVMAKINKCSKPFGLSFKASGAARK